MNIRFCSAVNLLTGKKVLAHDERQQGEASLWLAWYWQRSCCFTSQPTEDILPETQCGFRGKHSGLDFQHATSPRIVQGARQRPLHNDLLPSLTQPRPLQLKGKSYGGYCQQSPSFPVNVGVKQGGVLAPVIINLFLMAATLLFQYIKYVISK